MSARGKNAIFAALRSRARCAAPAPSSRGHIRRSRWPAPRSANGGRDCALIDINLASGPSFELAKQLREQQVLFLFVTGYDQEAIPSEFAGVQRLEKPIDLKTVVQSLVGILQGAA